jgi:PBP1b-binding outer membrane lipoprotein LpoB
MKTIFIGIVLLFLFSACTSIEAPATTFAPQTDNPTSLQKTTDVTPAATPSDAVYAQ